MKVLFFVMLLAVTFGWAVPEESNNCENPCITCAKDSANCRSCPATHYFKAYPMKGEIDLGKCTLCPNYCVGCTDTGDKGVLCKGCTKGSYHHPDNSLCYPCFPHCKECTVEGCTNCSIGYKKDGKGGCMFLTKKKDKSEPEDTEETEENADL